MMFAGTRVLVLGDAILDEYVCGEPVRLSPEAPVPVLKVGETRHALGGAANAAANVCSLGGRATLIATLGRDEPASLLRARAADAGVTLLACDREGRTTRKTRVLGGRQQLVRLDHEDAGGCTTEETGLLLRLFETQVEAADIVVISDYAKGVLSPALVRGALDAAGRAGRLVIVDPRPVNRDWYVGCDYVTPNWQEARAMLGLPDTAVVEDEVRTVARTLCEQLGAHVVLTLGADGIAFRDRAGRDDFSMPTVAREVFDVSGAGDTVVAAFAVASGAGASHRAAIAFANRAAGVAVGKFGTATVTADEVMHFELASRVVARADLHALADRLRAMGQGIVAVIDPFDDLCRARLHALQAARHRGGAVIAVIDPETRAPGEPLGLESVHERAEALLALRTVDYVHILQDRDAAPVLDALRPDVSFHGVDLGGGLPRAAESRIPGIVHR